MNLKLKSFLLLCVLLELVLCAVEIKISEAEYKAAFQNFKKQNKITYPDKHAELVGFTFFKDNYATVKEINLNFTDGNSTFKTSLNANAAHGDEFFAGNLANLIEEDDTFAQRNNDPDRFPRTNLTSLNYTELACATPVVNQGNCGSCYAFAVAAAIEGVCCKKNNKVVKLSEQQIVDCTFNDFYGNIGCNGGKISTAFTHVIDEGAVSSDLYPYRADDNSTCGINSNLIVQRIKNFKRFPTTVNDTYLMDALAAVGPLIIGMNGSSRSFQFYKSGIFNDPKCKKSVNHAVVLMGFGADHLGPYWILKNSYGPKWGELGYFRMARGEGNLCGMFNQIFRVECM